MQHEVIQYIVAKANPFANILCLICVFATF